VAFLCFPYVLCFPLPLKLWTSIDGLVIDRSIKSRALTGVARSASMTRTAFSTLPFLFSFFFFFFRVLSRSRASYRSSLIKKKLALRVSFRRTLLNLRVRIPSIATFSGLDLLSNQSRLSLLARSIAHRSIVGPFEFNANPTPATRMLSDGIRGSALRHRVSRFTCARALKAP